MKTDFKPYLIGTIHNPLKLDKKYKPKYESIEIEFPSRLNAMAIDPSKITQNKNLVYTPGEIVFSVSLFKRIKVSKNSTGQIIVSNTTKRRVLVSHAVILMQKALNDASGLTVEVDNQNEIRHAGLGSSSSVIAGVAAAINELYGNPISERDLVKYVAQNHGEEIDGQNEYLNPVQCIGGSAVSGIMNGGLFIIAGESEVIGKADISNSKKVVIGIPRDFEDIDSDKQFNEEKKNLKRFLRTGQKYGPIIAYRLLHNVLPSLRDGDLKTLGDLIFDYRFKMGSIKNCSYVYPPMVDLANKLKVLKKKKIVDVLAISSVGPAFFAITENTEAVKAIFEENNLSTIVTEISNDKYRVTKRQ